MADQVMFETQDLPRQMLQRANEEIQQLREQLEAVTRERDELSRNTCQLGTCVKCGNPAQDSTKEHFVDATASEGVSPPEDSRPQRVEAPQVHWTDPLNRYAQEQRRNETVSKTEMVDRIADILVEDHIALMKELEEVRRELMLEKERSFRSQYDELRAAAQAVVDAADGYEVIDPAVFDRLRKAL